MVCKILGQGITSPQRRGKPHKYLLEMGVGDAAMQSSLSPVTVIMKLPEMGRGISLATSGQHWISARLSLSPPLCTSFPVYFPYVPYHLPYHQFPFLDDSLMESGFCLSAIMEDNIVQMMSNDVTSPYSNN